MSFRRDVEGLRAVAVLAVVLYHCGIGAASGGFIGVDVFFVLSGYLITTLMLTEIAATSRLSFGNFYARRARRLLPAATIVIASTVAIGWFVVSPLTRRDLVGDALSAAAYAVNWRFAARDTDYFQAELAPSALQHYWSLAVEEQFYIVWPALIAVLAFGRVRRGVLAVGVGLIVVTSFVLCQVVTAASQPWAFFGLHTRMWQLGMGALAAIGWPFIERLPEVARLIAPLAGLAAIGFAATAFDVRTSWPGSAALVPTLGALGVIIGSQRSVVARLLATSPMVWIGARSYSWYLWHWPALVLFVSWRDVQLSDGVAVVVAAASLAVAHAGYTLVEQPIRHGRSLVVSARRSLAAGLAFTLVCLAGLLAVRPSAAQVGAGSGAAAAIGLPPPAAPATSAGTAPPSQPSTSAAPEPTLAELLQDAALVTTVPSNLRPSLADARDDVPEVYALGCHLDFPVIHPKICELGDADSTVSAVLFGDSHAAQWTPAFDDLAARSGIRFIPITKSGCPAADVTIFNPSLNRVYHECDEWRAEVFALLAEMKPNFVIIAQSAQVNADGVAEDARDDVIAGGWQRSLEALASSGADMIVLGDTPYPAVDVPDCLSAHLDDATACTTRRDNALQFRHGDPERVAATAAGAQYIDPADLVCGATSCPVVVGDLLVYRDDSHLTTPYVRWLGPTLATLLGGPWVSG